MAKVRVRFAPSPTGKLHIGGARTALFNWLFARKEGGSFILRIEDTDVSRSQAETVPLILEALAWLHLDWDEGPDKGGPCQPYAQSERLEIYTREAKRLLAEDKAYLCYCTPEELAGWRQKAQKEGAVAPYGYRCRNLSPAEREAQAALGRKPVVRLKAPLTGETVVRDLIRGEVTFQNEVLGDFILLKSNGMPTYNFACVVDDHAMGITHVIRAEEHLSNTPRQILLCQALGYSLPFFAHVPMILAPDRSKLSKRHGATSVEELREEGYLPEAVVNYLALLGWSPEDTEEIIPLSELKERFSLERVSRNPAIYDLKKLGWINGHYLKSLDLEVITSRTVPFLQAKGFLPPGEPTPEAYQKVKEAVGAVRDRVRTLTEVAKAAAYFFETDFSYEEKGVTKYFQPERAGILQAAREKLEKTEPFTLENVETAYRELSGELGIKTAELFHPTRLALTGRTMGPGLFEIMVVLGKEECLRRLERAISFILEQQKGNRKEQEGE